VIAGHGRLAAARLLGLTDVPVIPLRGLSEVQRRQLMLADNRIALNAGWDAEMLNLELKELSVMGADLAALGFTAQELADALNPGDEGLVDENLIPEVAEAAVTVPWDIWCLGPHLGSSSLRSVQSGASIGTAKFRIRFDGTGGVTARRRRLAPKRPNARAHEGYVPNARYRLRRPGMEFSAITGLVFATP